MKAAVVSYDFRESSPDLAIFSCCVFVRVLRYTERLKFDLSALHPAIVAAFSKHEFSGSVSHIIPEKKG